MDNKIAQNNKQKDNIRTDINNKDKKKLAKVMILTVLNLVEITATLQKSCLDLMLIIVIKK